MTVKDLYPECGGDGWFGSPGDYTPLLHSFGDVLLRVDDVDCQGDSRVLYRRGERDDYGLLIFGWGSCSGCDALQACDSYDDLQALADELRQSILWKTKDEMIVYLKEHDWDGDFCGRQQEHTLFVALALRYLENL